MGVNIFIIGCFNHRIIEYQTGRDFWRNLSWQKHVKILNIHFLTNLREGEINPLRHFCCLSRICNTTMYCCSICELRLLSVKWLSILRFSKFPLCLCQIHDSLVFVFSLKGKARAWLKSFKSISESTSVLKSIEDHLLLNQQLCILNPGRKD